MYGLNLAKACLLGIFFFGPLAHGAPYPQLRMGLHGSALFHYDQDFRPLAPIAFSSLRDGSVGSGAGLDLLLSTSYFNFFIGYQYLFSGAAGIASITTGLHNPQFGVDWLLLNSMNRHLRFGFTASIGLTASSTDLSTRPFDNGPLPVSSLLGFRAEFGRETGVDVRAGIDPFTRAYTFTAGFHFPLFERPDRASAASAPERTPVGASGGARRTESGPLAQVRIPISVLGLAPSKKALEEASPYLSRFKAALDRTGRFQVVHGERTPTPEDVARSEYLLSFALEKVDTGTVLRVKGMDLSISEIVYERQKHVAFGRLDAVCGDLASSMARELNALVRDVDGVSVAGLVARLARSEGSAP